MTSLLIAFVAVVGSFFLSSLLVQRSSDAIATLSESIVEDSAPSIEHMARVRRAALEAELALTNYVDRPTERAEQAELLDAGIRDANKNMREYFLLPATPAEQALHLDLKESLVRFESAMTRARELADTNSKAASDDIVHRVVPARHRFLDQATAVIEINANHGRDSATKIREVRHNAIRLAHGLNVLCGLFALFVAWSLYRQAVARRALAAKYVAALETRASELEQFAGRVAHDIRSPLAAARAASELAARRATDETSRELSRRTVRSLGRADTITTALLNFARSGATPDPGARTSVRAVIEEVVADVAHDAERARIELRTDPVPAVGVACSTGVYLSLLGNLVRNAIKYMRDAPTRRITVHVQAEGEVVRTEVIDTGPGIAADILPSLFKPYFRGPSGGAEGLGLGLATVKRLAEAHGGRAGVNSVRGKGSTFWFELPCASLADRDSEVDVGEEPVVHH